MIIVGCIWSCPVEGDYGVEYIYPQKTNGREKACCNGTSRICIIQWALSMGSLIWDGSLRLSSSQKYCHYNNEKWKFTTSFAPMKSP